MAEMEIRPTDDDKYVGFYYNGSIQWVSGIEYKKYCFQFDSVFRKMFPPNKIIYDMKNILIVGGGDMQLLSGTTMLSSDSITTLVDPNVLEYQKLLKENTGNMPAYIHEQQINVFDNKPFLTCVPMTIQEYLRDPKIRDVTYDLIVVDLIDELAVDEHNEYSHLLWPHLRKDGIMIGYGGVKTNNFLFNNPSIGYEIKDLVIETEHFKGWEDDCVVYAMRKAV